MEEARSGDRGGDEDALAVAFARPWARTGGAAGERKGDADPVGPTPSLEHPLWQAEHILDEARAAAAGIRREALADAQRAEQAVTALAADLAALRRRLSDLVELARDVLPALDAAARTLGVDDHAAPAGDEGDGGRATA